MSVPAQALAPRLAVPSPPATTKASMAPDRTASKVRTRPSAADCAAMSRTM
ncbi:MAG: hypothetical protein BWY91_00544 [bacterium ADurb.BinA028]|nr:MAG: hypothetical protein BWY91_00544 [bacterium ADurb.BinA028]